MRWVSIRYYSLAFILVVAGFFAAFQFVEPAPSRVLTLAAGPEGGAYAAFAEQYRAILDQSGIDLQIRSTEGSLENFELLQRGEVDIAFIQGGVGAPDRDRIAALGTLFLEPLWVFTRSQQQLTRFDELAGRTIAVGGEGSGSRALLSMLLQRSGMEDRVTLSPLNGTAASASLLDGTIDAVGNVASIDSPTVQKLAMSPEIGIANLARAEGFAQVFPYLDTVTLAEGVLDFARDHPLVPIDLLAAKAALLGKADLHPAHVAMLMITAREVHGNGDIFSAPGAFPKPNGTNFALNDEARRFYENGPPLLIRYLPFWLATFVDRMAILLLPFVTLLLPLARILPMALDWRFRSRVFRWYAEIADVEARATQEPDRGMARALERLEAIDRDVSALTVPAAYRHLVFNLRTHIDLVRSRLRGTSSTLAGRS